MSGGWGSGKTLVGLLKLIYLSDQYPNSRFAVIRRRATDLRKTTLATLWKLLPPSAYVRRNDQLGELELRNGSKFYFFHLEREGVANVLRGLELNSAFVDQAEEVDVNLIELLEDRLSRWDRAKIDPAIIKGYELNGKQWPWRTPAGVLLPPSHLILSCNPDTQLHWLWRRFHPDSPEWRNGTDDRPSWREKGHKLIHFDSRNNKFLSKKNLETMMSRGKDFVNRNVLGIWGRPEGSIFYIDPKSILDPTPDLLEKIKTECTLYRSLDHGFSAPTSCLWLAVDRYNNMFVYREYYNKSDQIRVHRHNITELSKNESYLASIADSEIFNMMPAPKGGRWSVALEYSDKRLYPAETSIAWGRADKNEMASRSRLIEYLNIDPTHKHPITGELGAPHLYFIQKTDNYRYGCDKSISETQAAKLTKVGEADGQAIFNDERDPEIPDHALDALRYGVMCRPMLPSTKSQTSNTRTFESYSKMSKAYRKRQRALENTYK